jgi:Holliday junction resolvase RusA-like endonuclease
MTDAIRIVVPGEPRGKGAPRFSVVCGHVQTRKDGKTTSAMSDLKLFASQAMAGAAPLSGPLAVDVRAYRAKGAPASKEGREAADAGLIRPTTKPDADNIVKMLDALTGVVWIDDAQIVSLRVAKLYDTTRPRLEIVVTAWQAREAA